MGDSDGAWNELATYADELAEVYDSCERLPEAGENEALDAFIERKGISVAALVRLGARLAAPTTLVFAFPGGLKYRDIVTDRRWSYTGSTWQRLKIIRHGPEPSSTVIVAEGETDSAWLSDHYDCDIACLPAGADPRPHTESYAEQLAGYELVLLGQDSDRAGDEGAAQLMDVLRCALRFAPPTNDWCSLGTEDPPPLPSPPAVDHAGGLIFDDLSELLRNGVPEPEVLVDDLLYSEGVHWISGHPDSGKTTLAMHSSIMVMHDGKHVVWLDYEAGTRGTVRRLLACQCPVELVLSQFHYAGWPQKPVDFFGDIAAQWPGALIVLDSASKALQMEGADENSPGEVTQWTSRIVKQCKDHELPVIIIDHVTKTATNTSRYARGAGSKLADSDVAWFVEKLEPFSRDQAGVIGVYRQKDREGYMPYASWYTVGDGHGNLPVVPTDEPYEADDADSTAQPAI